VERAVGYVQQQEKCSFLRTVTSVLPLSGGVWLRTETFSGAAEICLDSCRVRKHSPWQDRRIISDYNLSSVTSFSAKEKSMKRLVLLALGLILLTGMHAFAQKDNVVIATGGIGGVYYY
jgi:hypothetical protein